MRHKVRVALVGIAGYGDLYLETLLSQSRRDNVELVGCVDTTPQRSGRLGELTQRKIPVHCTVDRLFQETALDLAMIATPIHLHASHTCAALLAGANVLCEKPLAGSLEDAAQMAVAESAARRFVAIGYQWAFASSIQALKREILRGTFGRPRRMKTIVYYPRPSAYFARNGWVGRIQTESGAPVLDSPVNNATAHHLHTMLYLLGETRETSARPRTVQTERYRVNDIENFDTAAMRVITEADVEILFYTTHAAAERLGPVCEMEFDDAIVTFDGGSEGEIVGRFRTGERRVYGSCTIDHTEKIDACIDAVRSGGSVACGIEASLPHLLCVVAAHQSPTPIQTIPRAYHRTAAFGDDILVAVEGLSGAFRRCFEENLLPAEADVAPWAHPSEPVETGSLHRAHPPVRPAPQVWVAHSAQREGVAI